MLTLIWCSASANSISLAFYRSQLLMAYVSSLLNLENQRQAFYSQGRIKIGPRRPHTPFGLKFCIIFIELKTYLYSWQVSKSPSHPLSDYFFISVAFYRSFRGTPLDIFFQFSLLLPKLRTNSLLYKKNCFTVKVPPRFELGSLDSKSRVLTITPRDRIWKNRENYTFSHGEAFINDYICY